MGPWQCPPKYALVYRSIVCLGVCLYLTFILAWDGGSDDTPTQTTPSGMAHSFDDVGSSILIFTRAGTSSKQNQSS